MPCNPRLRLKQDALCSLPSQTQKERQTERGGGSAHYTEMVAGVLLCWWAFPKDMRHLDQVCLCPPRHARRTGEPWVSGCGQVEINTTTTERPLYSVYYASYFSQEA